MCGESICSVNIEESNEMSKNKCFEYNFIMLLKKYYPKLNILTSYYELSIYRAKIKDLDESINENLYS